MGILTTQDLIHIKRRRSNHTRLGFAYQLTFIRIHNRLPRQHELEINHEILTYVSLQLNLAERWIKTYRRHRQLIAKHQEQIRGHLLLQLFDQNAARRLRTFLFKESCQLGQVNMLLSKARDFLRSKRILTPSDDTLRRLIVTQRERARLFIHKKLASQLRRPIKIQLDHLLAVGDTRTSKLHRLKHPPITPSPKAILMLIEKLELIRHTGILDINICWINNNYQRSLAKYVTRCSADRLHERIPPTNPSLVIGRDHR